MTRDELQDAATRVCLAIASGAELSDVFDDARSVAVGLAMIELERTAKKRVRDTKSKRKTRARPPDVGAAFAPTSGGQRADSGADIDADSAPRPLPAPSQRQEPHRSENASSDPSRSEGEESAGASVGAAQSARTVGAAATRTKSNEILLWDAWEEVAGGGMPMGSPPYHDLGIAWTASAARSPSDPVGAFRAAAVKFVALKRRTKSPAKLVYLCREIGDYLPAAASAVEEPVLRRVKTLRELAAERDAEIAAKTPEQRAAELAALEAAQ